MKKSRKIDRLIKGVTLKEYLIQQMIKTGWRSLI
jgi:hypothetical protein